MKALAFHGDAKNESANTAEAIDTKIQGHCTVVNAMWLIPQLSGNCMTYS